MASLWQINPYVAFLTYFSVGDTGFEPVTSSVSGKRATTAPIAHFLLLGGEDGIRTRVDGFAGRCLASRPLHRCVASGHCERMTRFELATLTLAR